MYQVTNARLTELWVTGVRSGMEEDGVSGAAELRRCLEMAMGAGEKGEGDEKPGGDVEEQGRR